MILFGRERSISRFLQSRILSFFKIRKIDKNELTFHITNTTGDLEKPKNRDTDPLKDREMEQPSAGVTPVFCRDIQKEEELTPIRLREKEGMCPYCNSRNFVKRGMRQKKKEKVQLYVCRECHRTFTPFSVKGKRYSLPVILNAISYYNLGYSYEQVSKILRQKDGVEIQATSIANWYEEYKSLCAFSRMRQFAIKEFSPSNIIETATLAHRQLYRYRFHRAKAKLIIEESFRHYKFSPLKEFLEMVPGECPHQYFQEGLRASESPLVFNKKEMIVRGKENYATKLAAFVTQTAKTNEERHELLEKFMLANDSVTVACEIPVYLTREDLAHMQKQLGFKLYLKQKKGEEMIEAQEEELPKLITGHIDILQIRNGMIHILDYKPKAEKERPIEQLTLYALALSRLTGLRVFHFKCAWFDEKDYFEFYPLHAVYKPKTNRKRRKIATIEGEYLLNENINKIENLKPSIINK